MPKKINAYRNHPLARSIIVNGQKIDKIVISPHHEKNHSAYMKDEIILDLVKKLNGKCFPVEDYKTNPNREFFMLDNIPYQNKFYRLVWCL